MRKGYRPFCSNACAKRWSCKSGTRTRKLKNNGKYFSRESLEKQKQSFVEHYGVDNNMKCELGKKQLRDAVQQKHGNGIVNVF